MPELPPIEVQPGTIILFAAAVTFAALAAAFAFVGERELKKELDRRNIKHE